MKSLQESLLDDEEDLMNNSGLEKIIEKFLLDNYTVYNVDGNTPMKYKIYKKSGKWYVDVDCVTMTFRNTKLKHLTNKLFQFGTVGDFSRSTYSWISRGFSIGGYASKVETLEGAPEEILGDLNCEYCESLKSLKGCPKKIERTLNLDNCPNIKDIRDLKNLKRVYAIYASEKTHITEDEIKKYVPNSVCNTIYGDWQ